MQRKDAREMKELDVFHRFYTFLMPKRITSSCWTILQAEASELMAYMEEKKALGIEMTVFQVVLSALLRTASQYPELNRFIYGHKFYARKEYVISFAIDIEGKTIFRKAWLDPQDTLFEVADKIRGLVKSAREKPQDDLDNSVTFLMRLPTFMASIFLKIYPWLVDKGWMPQKTVQEDILFSSAIVSNLGTFGMTAPVHHLYEWGNASVFVTIGAIRKTPVALPDGTLKAADMIDFGFTVDERVCSGRKLSQALEFFKACIENPRTLENPPEKVMRE